MPWTQATHPSPDITSHRSSRAIKPSGALHKSGLQIWRHKQSNISFHANPITPLKYPSENTTTFPNTSREIPNSIPKTSNTEHFGTTPGSHIQHDSSQSTRTQERTTKNSNQ